MPTAVPFREFMSPSSKIREFPISKIRELRELSDFIGKSKDIKQNDDIKKQKDKKPKDKKQKENQTIYTKNSPNRENYENHEYDNHNDYNNSDEKYDISIRVITWNLMMITNNHDQNRLNIIKKRLHTMVQSGSILCLQEITDPMKNTLDQFFKNNNYEFIHVKYKNGYLGNNDELRFNMGIAIAFPNQKFKLLEFFDHKMIKLSQEGNNNNQFQNVSNIYEHIDNRVLSVVIERRMDRIDPIKKNVLISTCHFPCKYRDENLMSKLASSIREYHIKTTKDKKCSINFLAGDFNILPDTASYDALIGKNNNQNYLISCHKLKHGKEPEFTNINWNKGLRKAEFKGCLDYILSTQDTVNMIYEFTSLCGLMIDKPDRQVPNGVCPSDHFPVSIIARF